MSIVQLRIGANDISGVTVRRLTNHNKLNANILAAFWVPKDRDSFGLSLFCASVLNGNWFIIGHKYWNLRLWVTFQNDRTWTMRTNRRAEYNWYIYKTDIRLILLLSLFLVALQDSCTKVYHGSKIAMSKNSAAYVFKYSACQT